MTRDRSDKPNTNLQFPFIALARLLRVTTSLISILCWYTVLLYGHLTFCPDLRLPYLARFLQCFKTPFGACVFK